MKKKLLAIAFMMSVVAYAMSFSGCTTEKYSRSSHAPYAASFNEEQYIWQDFMFPTNRTSGRQ